MRLNTILNDKRYKSSTIEERKIIIDDWYEKDIKTDSRWTPEQDEEIRADIDLQVAPTLLDDPIQAEERDQALEQAQEIQKQEPSLLDKVREAFLFTKGVLSARTKLSQARTATFTKEVSQAGSRYPRAVFTALEAHQNFEQVNPEEYYEDPEGHTKKWLTVLWEGAKKGFVPEIYSPGEAIRSPTEIAWDMADRIYGNQSTSVTWEFMKNLPFTTAGVLGSIRLDPSIFLAFKGLGGLLKDPTVARWMGKEIKAPKWFDNIIKGTINTFYRPGETLVKNIKENRITTLTEEAFNKIKPQLEKNPIFKARFERMNGGKYTDNDLKGFIKKEFIKQGIYDATLKTIQTRINKIRKLNPELFGDQPQQPTGTGAVRTPGEAPKAPPGVAKAPVTPTPTPTPVVKPTPPVVKGITPLIEEAKKFKTADEFVASQDKRIQELEFGKKAKIVGKNFWVAITKSAKEKGKFQVTTFNKDNIPLGDFQANTFAEGLIRGLDEAGLLDKESLEAAVREGFIKRDELSQEELDVIDKQLTKSQLTDIWKKAQVPQIIKPSKPLLKKPIEKTIAPSGIVELNAGLPPITQDQKIKLENFFDVESPFRKIGAPKTGIAIKNYFSKVVSQQDQATEMVRNLTKNKTISGEDYATIAFVSERPGMFRDLSPADKKKFSPLYKQVRSYFDRNLAALKKEGLKVDFFENEKIRLSNRIKHLEASLGKLKSGDAFMNRMHGDKLHKWQGELEESKAILNRIIKGKFQFVHIPIRIWFDTLTRIDPAKGQKVLKFLTAKRRKTILIQDLVDAGLIDAKDVDIRDIIASYGNMIGRDLGLLDIIKNAKEEGLVKSFLDAPEEWATMPVRQFPMFRGLKIHPAFADYLTEMVNPRTEGKIARTWGKVVSTTKMWQFFNPLFLPMYDVVQAAMLGSVTNIKAPLYVKRAITDTWKKTPRYWEAFDKGLFSQPFANPFDSYMTEIERIKSTPTLVGALIQLLPQNMIKNIYTLSWNTAWGLDRTVRMISYNYLLEQGMPPLEAAQLAALYHGDYAGVPAKSRKLLNKVFFTPTFKIAMTKLYAGMLDGGSKVFTNRLKGAKPSKRSDILARGIGYTLGILFGKHYAMKMSGFQAEQFSRRYFREVDTEEEGAKELVITFANPANIPLRYYFRVMDLFDPSITNNMQRAFKALEWEFTPLIRVAGQIIDNRKPNGNYVYDPFDPKMQMIQIARFATAELLKISAAIVGEKEGEEKLKAFKQLQKEIGQFEAIIIRPFVFSYLRRTKDERVATKMRRLMKDFRWYSIQNVDNSDKIDTASEEFHRRMELLNKELE